MNERSILVVAHAGRPETVAAALRVVDALTAAGARPVLPAQDRDDLAAGCTPGGAAFNAAPNIVAMVMPLKGPFMLP